MEERTSGALLLTRTVVKETPKRDEELTVAQMTTRNKPSKMFLTIILHNFIYHCFISNIQNISIITRMAKG